MKRILTEFQLNLIAGFITLSILVVSANALWMAREETWQAAQTSSRNILTAAAHDVTNSLKLIDEALKGAIEGLRHPDFAKLSPDIQHRMLFDRAVPASFISSIIVVDASGHIIADAGPVLAPRDLSFTDHPVFQFHKQNAFGDLHISRPYKSQVRNGETSIAISRRITGPNGEFAGLVAVIMSLPEMQSFFGELDLGRLGAVNLFRNDGILLLRQPHLEGEVDRDFSTFPNTQRFIREAAGSFDGISAIDGVRRLYTFEHLDGFPLVLVVANAVDEVFADWNHKALLIGAMTLILGAAVMGLTVLFQRELHRRTLAERKLTRLARTDPLTGLTNRRAFEEAFERDWRQAIRMDTPLSLLFIDGDLFKEYNDLYGHRAGDDLLRVVAAAISAGIRRPHDFAARYGGEEFVVLLPVTDAADARLIAERIRSTVEEKQIVHKQSRFGVATVSIGLASSRSLRDPDRSGLIEAADAALYEAKAAGRNCVRVSNSLQWTTLPVSTPRSSNLKPR